MKNDVHLTALPWEDYELLDSGENMKLERFGEIVVARPETQALWLKMRSETWAQAAAEFQFKDQKGSWIAKNVPESWQLSWNAARFSARLTGFKHVGVFPEQEANWSWIRDRVEVKSDMQVLNLFGYTGIASIIAAQAGAFVTHVDASKQSLDWAHENARLSGLPDDRIRWMLDDALAFAKREVRREKKYDGIILDPPAFGRGSKGEVWRIEDDLPALLTVLEQLLSKDAGSFFLMNGYAAGYAAPAFSQAIESVFGEVEGESGELRIKEAHSNRVIPSGIYARFIR